MKISISFCVALSIALTGCASPPNSNPGQGYKAVGMAHVSPGVKPQQKILNREELPAGFAIGEGEPSLGLIVRVNHAKTEASPTTDLALANVTLKRGSIGSGTSAEIHSKLDLPLKFDLYISPDGQRYRYTSTCVVIAKGSAFEMWPSSIRSFALGNPRVVGVDQMGCN